MSRESDYIRSLERRIKELEKSKGYRWTRSFRRILNIFSNCFNLLAAIPLFLNKKREADFREINYKKYIEDLCEVIYNRQYGQKIDGEIEKLPVPISGFWEKYPWLHYCIFNRRIRLDVKIRPLECYDKLDAEKPTVILVTHDTSRTGAPILVYDLLKRFKKTHNVAVFSISEGSLSKIFEKESSFFLEPISRAHITEIVSPELDLIKEKSKQVFAVVNSIVSTAIMKEFWIKDIPSIHLIHEFASYTRPRNVFDDSFFYSDAMVFSANAVLRNAVESSPALDYGRQYLIPQGVCPAPQSEVDDKARERELIHLKEALRPKGWPEDTKVILGAGSVHIRKGVDLFVSCAKKVLALNPGKKIRFVWIGAGFKPESDLYYSCFLQDQISRTELGECFSIINDINEFDEVYKLVDVLFLSSRLDPLPLVAQGALFHKTPLVCFDGAGGMPEYLKQDPVAANGVVPFLDIDSAALKISQLISDKELSIRMAEAGHNLAREIFDQDRYFKKIGEIRDAIVEERQTEASDCHYIIKNNLLNRGFAYPHFEEDPGLAAKHYTRAWRRGMHVRKPFPGFHPGIYRDLHPETARDPLVDYHASGSIQGAWNTRIITPSANKNESSAPLERKVALHIHLHYPEVAEGIFSRIKNSKTQPDLFVSVTSEQGMKEVERVLAAYGLSAKRIIITPNRGRDIAPLFTGYREIFESGYDFVGHVHGKKSVLLGGDTGKVWADFLYENLLGGRHEMMDVIIETMSADPTLGLVFPEDPHAMGWNKNRDEAVDLAKKMGLKVEIPKGSLNFPVGTMFWARPEALKPLLDVKLDWEDFPEEPVPYDGSMLHAIERMLPLVAEDRGYGHAATYVEGVTR